MIKRCAIFLLLLTCAGCAQYRGDLLIELTGDNVVTPYGKGENTTLRVRKLRRWGDAVPIDCDCPQQEFDPGVITSGSSEHGESEPPQ